MSNLLEKLNKMPRDVKSYKPRLYNLVEGADRESLENLLSSGAVIDMVDEYTEQLDEYSIVKDPTLLTQQLLHTEKTASIDENSLLKDVWVYYPWRRSLVHLLEKDAFYSLTTSRNHNLITTTEQEQFKNFRVGIAGLNVGNPVAICLALEGGAMSMKFADNDVLSASNFNRFRASLFDLGLNKAILSARQAFEINPFLDIEVFADGVVYGKEEEFLLEPKIDILIEEMDNLSLKISIREKAKQHKIPVVMVTGNGSNLVLDIERYDLDADLHILNDKLSNDILNRIENMKRNKISLPEHILLARDFMGENTLVRRLYDAFADVGKSLAGIPQLAETSFLRGAVLTYVIRNIALNKEMPSGRYYVMLDNIVKK